MAQGGDFDGFDDVDAESGGAGLFDVFVEGVPERMKITLPRNIALHVDGPSPNVLAFDREGFVRVGTGLQSPGFETSPCRMSLHFSQAIPKLEIEWVSEE